MNHSQYILVELPFHDPIIALKDMIFELKIKGLIPIIAHPERYSYFQEDPELISDLKDEGILYQCNYGSIIGQYGRGSKKLIKYMLKNKLVDFLGTDIHRDRKAKILDKFPKIEHKIKKIAGKKYYEIIKNNSDELSK